MSRIHSRPRRSGGEIETVKAGRKASVTCGSMPVRDAESPEDAPVGWIYGFHFYKGEKPDRCPRCGASMGDA